MISMSNSQRLSFFQLKYINKDLFVNYLIHTTKDNSNYKNVSAAMMKPVTLETLYSMKCEHFLCI